VSSKAIQVSFSDELREMVRSVHTIEKSVAQVGERLWRGSAKVTFIDVSGTLHTVALLSYWTLPDDSRFNDAKREFEVEVAAAVGDALVAHGGTPV
jgi:hypothetical protein